MKQRGRVNCHAVDRRQHALYLPQQTRRNIATTAASDGQSQSQLIGLPTFRGFKMQRCLLRLFAVLMLVCGSSVWAADALVEGRDYQALLPAQPTSNPAKIVVTEFFSYECSHCFAFYPVVTAWAAKLPKDVVFDRVPVSLGRTSWQPISQAFYALQAIDKLDQLDRLLFNAIHVQNIKLFDEATITAFVAKQGVNAAEFTAAYNSFSAKSNVQRAEQMMKAYKVQGTPALVVDGKYIVLAEGTKTHEEWLARADQVIAKARADRAHK
jgi:thiol:disulfide interchange protein DsbA